MAEKTDLLIIDPQRDFCDPDIGTLVVPEAKDDMSRLASMIRRYKTKINRIHVTLDCHNLLDVAHPPMWKNGKGERPDPFTIITSQEIIDGVWTPVFPGLRQRYIEYTAALEKGGKYLLIIWPPHCLIGSKGNNVVSDLFDALIEWEEVRPYNVNFVSKGSNPHTEHYSAVQAEVPDPADETTQLNVKLIETVRDVRLLTAGEALSHCLKSTVEDIANGFKDDECIKNICLLTDATSPVPQSPGGPDFPAIGQQFIDDMKARQMQTALTTDF